MISFSNSIIQQNLEFFYYIKLKGPQGPCP